MRKQLSDEDFLLFVKMFHPVSILFHATILSQDVTFLISHYELIAYFCSKQIKTTFMLTC